MTSVSSRPRREPSTRALTTPGLRATRQRAAVERLLTDTDEFRSAQELHALLLEQGDRVGLATVYRTLQALADARLVDTLVRSDGETTYRRCGDGHHHHLVCRVCATAVEVEGRAAETWARRVAAQHGFSDIEHTIEIVGVCGACAAKA